MVYFYLVSSSGLMSESQNPSQAAFWGKKKASEGSL